jgi:hypothetical protein
MPASLPCLQFIYPPALPPALGAGWTYVANIAWPAAWLRCRVSKNMPGDSQGTPLLESTALLAQTVNPQPGCVSLHMRTGGSPPVVGALELELSAAPAPLVMGNLRADGGTSMELEAVGSRLSND